MALHVVWFKYKVRLFLGHTVYKVSTFYHSNFFQTTTVFYTSGQVLLGLLLYMKNISMIKKWLFGVVLVRRRSSDRFFKETVGQPVMVNGNRYGEIIRDFVIPDLRENRMKGYCFQLDKWQFWLVFAFTRFDANRLFCVGISQVQSVYQQTTIS